MEKKIWGTKERLLETSTVVVDRLTLEANSFCSWHYHEFKYNMFIVLEGNLWIDLADGLVKLEKGEQYIADPKLQHRFITSGPAKIIEIMYTKPVLEDDIIRSKQGGKIYGGQYLTEEELQTLDHNNAEIR